MPELRRSSERPSPQSQHIFRAQLGLSECAIAVQIILLQDRSSISDFSRGEASILISVEQTEQRFPVLLHGHSMRLAAAIISRYHKKNSSSRVTILSEF